ncbi:hypothetical protein ABZ016_24115 [Streptomyces sp. NPDC006372]|uniref:hypothetical protein n=1 Tax=Streptomyces sp. NPDC006372 TaxID=3155599 RepID=UPI0033A8C3D3
MGGSGVKLLVIGIATLAAAIAGSLLSDEIGKHVPSGKIALGVLIVVTVLGTATSLLLSQPDGTESLGVIRQRISDTLGVVSSLALAAGVFLVFVHYAPGWGRALLEEEEPALRGGWSGEVRQGGFDRPLKSTLKVSGSADSLNGSFTVVGKNLCEWAVSGHAITADSTDATLDVNKERGPWICSENGYLHVKLLSDRRISVEQDGWVFKGRSRWQVSFSGVLKPAKE